MKNPKISFKTYLEGLLSRGFDGADIDYRDYKKPLYDYNQETLEILKQQTRKMYGVGGLDTHNLFS